MARLEDICAEHRNQKLKSKESFYLLTDDYGLQLLGKHFNFHWILLQPDYHITALTGAFLNPATRSSKLGNVHLIAVDGVK